MRTRTDSNADAVRPMITEVSGGFIETFTLLYGVDPLSGPGEVEVFVQGSLLSVGTHFTWDTTLGYIWKGRFIAGQKPADDAEVKATYYPIQGGYA